jgi:hypothetical protein
VEFGFVRNRLRLAHLGLKPEATAEGSQLKRAVGLFEVYLRSKLFIGLELPTQWTIFIMAVVKGRRPCGLERQVALNPGREVFAEFRRVMDHTVSKVVEQAGSGARGHSGMLEWLVE